MTTDPDCGGRRSSSTAASAASATGGRSRLPRPGRLLFQEVGNAEVPEFFAPGTEYVAYRDGDLESLLKYYLGHDEERRAIAAVAWQRVRGYGFEAQW